MDKTNTKAVEEYITSLDDQTKEDAKVLLKMMRGISGKEGGFFNSGTIGFDSYHYKYESGREGDSFVIGFYPRKGKTTIYVMDGIYRYTELLEKLGKHTITGYCIYIKKLTDVDFSILEEIIKESFNNIKTLSKKGPIDRILWQNK